MRSLFHFPLIFSSLLAVSTIITTGVDAQAISFRPASIPLAVKTPYLNTWLNGRQSDLPGNWPSNGGGSITGWAGYVRVDGKAYRFMGAAGVEAPDDAEQTDVQVTATQTNFVFSAGLVTLRVSFLSPIEANDFSRMSMPFSYVAITAESADGSAHDVQIYCDVAGEFISGDTKQGMTWTTVTKGDMIYHEFGLASPQLYIENSGRIQYGLGYHATKLEAGVSYQTGRDETLRSLFQRSGRLQNQRDTNFRAVDDQWPVMALSRDFGRITDRTPPVVFVLGLDRDPVVQYAGLGGTQDRSLYFRSQFSTTSDALSFFLKDYSNALEAANGFDSKLDTEGKTISSDYASIVALAARQTFAKVEITIGRKSDNTFDTEDVLAFMGPQNTTVLDTLFAASPFWLYTNPSVLRLLLQPIVDYHRRVVSSEEQQFVIQGLGESYPQVLAPTRGGDSMPLEATSDMIVMAAAYTQVTGDASLIIDNVDLFTRWADFLVDSTLYPAQQTSSDGRFLGRLANDTNLAVKGIIGLKAYGDILGELGRTESTKYRDAAVGFAQEWQRQTLNSDGIFLVSYGSNDDSWSSVYNLFIDKWLKTGLFSEDIFARASTMYTSEFNDYGVPIDSRETYTKPEWTLFQAGVAPDSGTRNRLIGAVVRSASKGQGNRPFNSLYDTVSGNITSDHNNQAVVGGVYSLLAQAIEHRPVGSGGGGGGNGGGGDNSGNQPVGGSATQHIPRLVLLAGLSLIPAIVTLI